MRTAAPPDKTFDELCDYWLEKRAPRKRSRKDDKSIIGKHLRPTFGRMRLRDIGVEEGDDYINEREHLGDKTIANHLTLLTTMLNVATGNAAASPQSELLAGALADAVPRVR